MKRKFKAKHYDIKLLNNLTKTETTVKAIIPYDVGTEIIAQGVLANLTQQLAFNRLPPHIELISVTLKATVPYTPSKEELEAYEKHC